jgi:hypothetical protein
MLEAEKPLVKCAAFFEVAALDGQMRDFTHAFLLSDS